MTFEPHEAERPVVRDRRRIDPVTGKLREQPAAAAPDPASGAGDAAGETAAGSTQDEAARAELADLEVQLKERTADLQRLQAEYVNYKRRVDRDRENVRASAVAAVVAQLLPTLDDIGRAREHGELTGGFRAVAESLERTVSGLGLVSFGEPGDRFDPRIHEALMHSYSDEVSEPVAQTVLQVGYRIGDRVIRPARVAVAEPVEAVPETEPPADLVDAESEPDGEQR